MSGSRAALESAGQPSGPSKAAAQLALGAALGASAAPGSGLPAPAATAAREEALAALQAAVALAPDDPAALYSLGLMQVRPIQRLVYAYQKVPVLALAPGDSGVYRTLNIMQFGPIRAFRLLQ